MNSATHPLSTHLFNMLNTFVKLLKQVMHHVVFKVCPGSVDQAHTKDTTFMNHPWHTRKRLTVQRPSRRRRTLDDKKGLFGDIISSFSIVEISTDSAYDRTDSCNYMVINTTNDRAVPESWEIWDFLSTASVSLRNFNNCFLTLTTG
jgi:hypothetical protein